MREGVSVLKKNNKKILNLRRFARFCGKAQKKLKSSSFAFAWPKNMSSRDIITLKYAFFKVETLGAAQLFYIFADWGSATVLEILKFCFALWGGENLLLV